MGKLGYPGFSIRSVYGETLNKERAILLLGGKGGELISASYFESGLDDFMEDYESHNYYRSWLDGEILEGEG